MKIKNWLRGLALGGLITLGGLIGNKARAAPSFTGFIYDAANGASAKNSTVHVIKPDKTDTVTTQVNFYVPRKKAWFWTRGPPAEWNLLGDTCEIFVEDTSSQQANTWNGPAQDGSNVVIPLFPEGYTIAIRNINDSDTLAEGKCWIKHNGIYSDTVIDTFNLIPTDYDFALNLAESESVKVWAPNRTWNNLLGDSIFVYAKAINESKEGSSKGVIERKYTDGDMLSDITLETVDTKPPGKPTALLANGSSPSPWTNDSNFTISWTNPSDSDLEKALYKIGAPATDWDTTGSWNPTSPQNVSVTSEGINPLYLWLADSSGNTSKDSSAVVNLRYDATKPSGSVASSPDTSKTLDFIVNWTAGSDAHSGVKSYDVKYKKNSGSWIDWISDTTSTSATFTGENNNTYYFESAARDSADNLETFTSIPECSTVVDTTTPDTTPPSISNVTEWPDTNFAGPYDIESKIYDESGVDSSKTWLRFWKNGEANSTNAYLINSTDSTWTFSIPKVDTTADTTRINYQVKATDASNNYNESESGIQSFLVDAKKPDISYYDQLEDTYEKGPFTVRTVASDATGIDLSKCNLEYKVSGNPESAPVDSAKADTTFYTIPAQEDTATISYSAKIADNFGNYSETPEHSFKVKTNGIGEQAKQPEKFRAWYARDGLHIKGAKQASVYDLVGRKVLDGLDNGIHKIRTPSGVYFVSSGEGKGGETEKVVKLK